MSAAQRGSWRNLSCGVSGPVGLPPACGRRGLGGPTSARTRTVARNYSQPLGAALHDPASARATCPTPRVTHSSIFRFTGEGSEPQPSSHRLTQELELDSQLLATLQSRLMALTQPWPASHRPQSLFQMTSRCPSVKKPGPWALQCDRGHGQPQ